jgi:Rrf2 family iron-sulfur cluster assembly transcriptional regulator
MALCGSGFVLGLRVNGYDQPWRDRVGVMMVDYLQSVTLSDLVFAQQNRNVSVLSPFINNNKPAKVSSEHQTLNVVDAKSQKKETAPKRFIVNSVFNLAQQN